MAVGNIRTGKAKKSFDCGVPTDRCKGRVVPSNKGAGGHYKCHGSFEEARRCQMHDERKQNANALANGGRIWYSKPKSLKPGKTLKGVCSPKWRG